MFYFLRMFEKPIFDYLCTIERKIVVFDVFLSSIGKYVFITMNWKFLSVAVLFCGLFCECGSPKVTQETVAKSHPCVIIYKTNSDYADLVPIGLNASKTRVESFPAPSDLYRSGKLAKPIDMGNGYLLDRQGISVNSVFLNISYEEYKRLRNTPNPSWFMDNIKDKKPFREFYCIDMYPENMDTLKRIVRENFQDKRVKRLL